MTLSNMLFNENVFSFMFEFKLIPASSSASTSDLSTTPSAPYHRSVGMVVPASLMECTTPSNTIVRDPSNNDHSRGTTPSPVISPLPLTASYDVYATEEADPSPRTLYTSFTSSEPFFSSSPSSNGFCCGLPKTASPPTDT
eukprot:CAMPEP_0184468466 /NCGR_PEP_ID=MMETSP0740-20130409/79180_1 /TAXON_ID=385413 /ORGANISM="Thalassiosira miniscula, Strain CCMP1093" /LENGTH=140 /DNA_ID=CAMNT_0026844069 /DNA_START=37 /DNA_END=459 /DNA_ORIENTATION=-